MNPKIVRIVLFCTLSIFILVGYTNCQPSSSASSTAAPASSDQLPSSNKVKSASHTVNLLMDQPITSSLDLNSIAGFNFDPGTMAAQVRDESTTGLLRADFLLDGRVNLSYTPKLNFFGEDRATILITDKKTDSLVMEVAVLFNVNSSDTNKLLISGSNQTSAGNWGFVEIKKVGSVDFVNQPTRVTVSALGEFAESLVGLGVFMSQQTFNDLSVLDPEAVTPVKTFDITGNSTVYFYYTLLKSGSTQLRFQLSGSENNITLGNHDLYNSHNGAIASAVGVGPATVVAYQCVGPFLVYHVDKYGNKWLGSYDFKNLVVDEANQLFENFDCSREVPNSSGYRTRVYSPRFNSFYARLVKDDFGSKVSGLSAPSNISFSNCVNLDGANSIKLYFNMGSAPATKIFSYSTNATSYTSVPAASIKTDYIDLGFLYNGSNAAKIYYFKLINSNGTVQSTPLIVRVRTADSSGSSILPGSCSVD